MREGSEKAQRDGRLGRRHASERGRLKHKLGTRLGKRKPSTMKDVPGTHFTASTWLAMPPPPPPLLCSLLLVVLLVG